MGGFHCLLIFLFLHWGQSSVGLGRNIYIAFSFSLFLNFLVFFLVFSHLVILSQSGLRNYLYAASPAHYSYFVSDVFYTFPWTHGEINFFGLPLLGGHSTQWRVLLQCSFSSILDGECLHIIHYGLPCIRWSWWAVFWRVDCKHFALWNEVWQLLWWKVMYSFIKHGHRHIVEIILIWM